MNKRRLWVRPLFCLWICAIVACGDDDSAEPKSEGPYDDGEWVCYDFGNECLCHIARSDESPSAETPIVDNCVGFACCVSFIDEYSRRCNCRNIRTDCQLETEGKTSASVAPQCPP